MRCGSSTIHSEDVNSSHTGTNLHKARFLHLHLLRGKWEGNRADILCNLNQVRNHSDHKKEEATNIYFTFPKVKCGNKNWSDITQLAHRMKICPRNKKKRKQPDDLLLSFPVDGSWGSCRPRLWDMGVLFGLVWTDPLRGCALYDTKLLKVW